MNEENQRGFTGWWIPEELRREHKLSWAECHLWAEIHAFSKGPNGCFASNAHFAEHLGVKEMRVSQLIAGLKAKGFIRQVGFDGRRRRLEITARLDSQPKHSEIGGLCEKAYTEEAKTVTLAPPSNREKEKSKEKAKEEERASAQPLSVPKVEVVVSKPRRTSRNVQPSPEARAIIQAFAEVYRSRFNAAYVPDPRADVTAATFFADAGCTPEQVASTFEAATRSKGFWSSKATTLPVLFRRWNEIQAELTKPLPVREASGASDSQVATEEWLAGMNGE